MVVEVVVPVRGAPRAAALHLPTGRPLGTVVFVHGSGPGSAGGFPSLCERFASLGIACLVVEKVMDGYTMLRRDYDALAADARDAVAWARGRPELRERPLALLGYSEGGWVATSAAALAPELVDLVVLCSSPLTTPRSQTAYHWANLNPRAPRAARRLRHALMWIAMAILTDYGNQDTTARLRSIAVPVVLVLGAKDPTVDVDRAFDVFARVRPDDSAILVPDCDHHLPAGAEWTSRVARLIAAR